MREMSESPNFLKLRLAWGKARERAHGCVSGLACPDLYSLRISCIPNDTQPANP